MIQLCAPTLLYAGYPLETALRELARAGFQAVDLWGAPRLCPHVDPVGDDPARLRQLLSEFGLRPATLSLHGSDVTRALAGIDFAEAIGAPLVVASVAAESLGEVGDYLRPLLKRAAVRSVGVAVENHAGSPLQSLAEMRELLSAMSSPHLGIAYAARPSLARGEPPDAVIRALGPDVALFYACDAPPGYRHGSRELLWSDSADQAPGDLGLPAAFEALHEVSFCGYADIICRGPEGWDLPRITASLRAASRLVASHLGY